MQITPLQMRDGLHIDYRDATRDAMSTAHAHTHIEIFYCLTGGIGCLIGGGMFTVNEQEVVLFAAGRPHRTFIPVDTPYRRYTVSFFPDEVMRFAPGCTELLGLFRDRDNAPILPLGDDPERARFHEYFERLYRCREDRTTHGRMQRFLCLMDILLFLAERKPPPGETPEPASLHASVLPVITYLNENFCARISLGDLAERFFMSRSMLTRSFRAATGLSVGDYVKGLRLVQAKNLLIGGASLTDVTHDCGFGSVSQFIRVFGAETGYSPKQFARYNRFFDDAYRYGRH